MAEQCHTESWILVNIWSDNGLFQDGTKSSSWRNQMETFFALLAHCEGNPPVTGGFPHKGQWRRALMLSLICAWTNGRANNRDACDLRRHRANYDVTVPISIWPIICKMITNKSQCVSAQALSVSITEIYLKLYFKMKATFTRCDFRRSYVSLFMWFSNARHVT